MSEVKRPRRRARLGRAAGEPEIDSERSRLAAFLAWLVPGLGHFYQGRTAKGVLFLVCILGTFLYGLYLGDGHVVYASTTPNILTRWQYLFQLGVGCRRRRR